MASSTIILAAISSRAYVNAAVEAGFEVIAIDAFADVDTEKLAKKTFQVDVHHGQFERRQLLNVLSELDLSECQGFCYGAGFEAISSTLGEIDELIPLIGNAAETVRNSKDPRFFCALCDELVMAYPETSFEAPSVVEGWLVKAIGESGGMHIRHLTPDAAAAGNVYYQKIQAGEPMSCLFLASGEHARIIGYNAQWCSPAEDFLYRYGGAVSRAELSESNKVEIESFVNKVTQKLGLRGLNSFDFILYEHRVFAIEINPRLSATLDLYRTRRGSLFGAHVMATLEGKLQALETDEISRAHQILYAKQATDIASDIHWPEWVSDIPHANSKIGVGMPICTVTAKASSAEEARRIVNERAIEIGSRMN